MTGLARLTTDAVSPNVSPYAMAAQSDSVIVVLDPVDHLRVAIKCINHCYSLFE